VDVIHIISNQSKVTAEVVGNAPPMVSIHGPAMRLGDERFFHSLGESKMESYYALPNCSFKCLSGVAGELLSGNL
jgi:hypothetical protein